MPKRTDIDKILIIGSGPTIIGQAGEFDGFNIEACRTLKSLGYKVVLVNSNPSTISTDPHMADVTYLEPLNNTVITEIILRERPDAILPIFSGQPGLNLTRELKKSGVLDEYGVELIGVNVEALEKGEDRPAVRASIEGLGIEMPKSKMVDTPREAEEFARNLVYPIIIRPSFTVGGTGGGMVYNVEELRTVAARGLDASPAHQILVEESVLGWKELELEIIRDADGRKITVCFIENIDAMGIHTGDSICTIPMLTVAPDLQRHLQDTAYGIIDSIGFVGGANIRFAHHPIEDRIVVHGIKLHASRSSSFASKATGLSIARIVTQLAVGLTLKEIPHGKGRTLETYTPFDDRIAIKFPKWAFDAFGGVEDVLGARMRAVGQVMSVGKTFKEAFQKAVRSLNADRYGLGFVHTYKNWPKGKLISALGIPSSERQFQLYEALRSGAGVDDIYEITNITPWFIEQIKELVELEEEILGFKDAPLPDELLTRAKKDGFADRYLALMSGKTEREIRDQRKSAGIVPSWVSVPFGESESAAYRYSSYNTADNVSDVARKKIMVLGSGPNRIGQGAEFDYCCVHASSAFRKVGYETIMVNCNPDSVSMDNSTADTLYVEPLTVEELLGIYEKEKPEGVIVQFGGETPMKIAGELQGSGITILGTPPETIGLAADRDHCRKIMRKLGIPMAESETAGTVEKAFHIVERIGYPVLVYPSDESFKKQVEVIRDQESLKEYLELIAVVSPERPVVVERFLDNAIEAEADLITDGADAYLPSVIEQIELAGIHAGDSACVIPPISIPPKFIDTIYEYNQKIVTEMKLIGLAHVQYAIYENTVYIRGIKPNAYRTVPVVSKVCDFPLVEIASEILLGKTLPEMDLKPLPLVHYGVREAVFPFSMLPEVDPVLGLKMKSTGEVLGLSHSFGRAFFKAQEATKAILPMEGSVLFTIADRDKFAAIEPARRFRDLNFRIMTTKGTHRFFKEHGIDTEPVHKVGFGRPDLVDVLKTGKINLLVNTPSSGRSQRDSSNIRMAAIKYNIPYITTTAAAIAAAKGIGARREGKPKIRSLQEYHATIHGQDAR